MCHESCIVFGATNLSESEIRGKTVLEVGSYYVNGSLRPILKRYNPAKYLGVDIEKGPGVDVVCDAEHLPEMCGKESYDVVVATELMEHVIDWRKVINNLKCVCRRDGIILITTRSHGFPFHAVPFDFWRYEVEDMKEIFSDCEILALEKDEQAPGVFIKVHKPQSFVARDLTPIQLYSMVLQKRITAVSKKDYVTLKYKKQLAKRKLKNLIKKQAESLYNKI